MRLLEKSVLETMTRGKRLVKIVATTRKAPAAVSTNAQPLRPSRTQTTAPSSAAIASSAGRSGGKTSLSLRSTATATVQIRNAGADDGRRDREPACRRRRAPAQLAGRAQREVGRAVEREQQHDRDPAEQRVER